MQRSWHRGYLIPVLLALLIHIIFFIFLLETRTVVSTVPATVSGPIVSYLYTPAVVKLTEQVSAQQPVRFTDLAQLIHHAENKQMPKELVAEPIVKAESVKSTTIVSDNVITASDHDDKYAQVTSMGNVQVGSLAERAMYRIQQQYNAAEPTNWAQQQVKITVEKPYQHVGSNPAKAVLFTYNDGQQLVRVGERCLVVDPMLSGFEQLIAAKGATCRESDDAILFRQTMAKWLNR